jgi:hypothetical protein
MWNLKHEAPQIKLKEKDIELKRFSILKLLVDESFFVF